MQKFKTYRLTKSVQLFDPNVLLMTKTANKLTACIFVFQD